MDNNKGDCHEGSTDTDVAGPYCVWWFERPEWFDGYRRYIYVIDSYGHRSYAEPIGPAIDTTYDSFSAFTQSAD